MKTMEEAEREAHGYWFDRAEKAERECDEWKVKEERARAARNRQSRRNQRLSGELAAALTKLLRLEKNG